MVNTNADIAFGIGLIVLGGLMLWVIIHMIRTYYREQRRIEAREAQENAARLADIRNKNRVLAEQIATKEADRKARAAEPRIPHLPPYSPMVLRPRNQVMSEIQRNPPSNLPVDRMADERFRQQEERRRQDEAHREAYDTAREQQRRRDQEAFRREHEEHRRARIRREEEQQAQRAGDTSTDTYYIPDFTPSAPSKPDTSIEAGGGSSGGAGASASWDSPASSSSESGSSSSPSSSSD